MNTKYKIDEDSYYNELRIDYELVKKFSKKYFKLPIDEKSFEIKSLTSGAYGNLFILKNKDKQYVLKKPAADEIGDKRASEAEASISAILSSFQHIYLKKKYFSGSISKIIPKTYAIYDCKVSGMKNIIMEKLKGDIFDIVGDLDLEKIDDRKFLIELLYQISSHLYLLQKYFKFMHNDLKQNNILYKLKDESKPISHDNILFVISDFGGSTITFNEKIIKGEVKGNDLYYDKAKDLYLLVHIIITYIKSHHKKSLINFLKILFDEINLKDCIKKDDTWHKLYEKSSYPKEYEPANLLKKLHKIKAEDNTSDISDSSNLVSLNINDSLNKKYKYLIKY